MIDRVELCRWNTDMVGKSKFLKDKNIIVVLEIQVCDQLDSIPLRGNSIEYLIFLRA